MGIRQLPDFAESLRILFEEEEYSQYDVSLMFGVTRERIRQLAKELGINAPGRKAKRGVHAVRIWDDEAHRFRPHNRRGLKETKHREAVETRRIERNIKIIQRRKVIVESAKALKARIGKDPTIIEIASEIAGRPVKDHYAGPYLLHAWGAIPEIRRGELTAKEVFDTIRRLADIGGYNRSVMMRKVWKKRRLQPNGGRLRRGKGPSEDSSP